MLRARVRSKRTLVLATSGLTMLVVGCSTAGGASNSASTVLPLTSANFVTLPPVTVASASSTPPSSLETDSGTTVAEGAVTVVTAGAQPPAESGGTTYKVVAGDTVSQIAKRFGLTADALATVNAWSNGVSHAIYPGDSVRIPPGAKETSNATTTTVPETGATYIVVAGDTVSGIAARAGISAKSLAAQNGWSDGANHAIFPGDAVKLPANAKPVASPTSSTTTAPESPTTTVSPAGAFELYTVVANDYLAGIAAKKGTTVAAIVTANGWPDGAQHVIIPGQQIKVPVKSA